MIIYHSIFSRVLLLQVGLLHGMMSNKEYAVIINCFYMNLNEQPKLPPSFRGDRSASIDTIRILADRLNMNGQVLLSRTVSIVSVQVDHALLELHHGVLEEFPLGHVSVSICISITVFLILFLEWETESYTHKYLYMFPEARVLMLLILVHMYNQHAVLPYSCSLKLFGYHTE